MESLGSPTEDETTSSPPNTLNFNGAHRKRKTLVAPEINISLDQSEGSILSDDFLDTPDDLDINVDDIETPDETDSLEFLGNGNELEWEDDTPVATAKNMPGDSADLFGDGGTEDGSATNGRLWRTVIIGEQEHRIDLQMIKPYMRVVTHGGEATAPRLCPSGSRWRGRQGWPDPVWAENIWVFWCLCVAEKHRSAQVVLKMFSDCGINIWRGCASP